MKKILRKISKTIICKNKMEILLDLRCFVLIVDIATKAPKRYEPLSPRKIFAFGKLYLKKYY